MPACWHVDYGVSNSALVHLSVPDDTHSAASIRPPLYVAHDQSHFLLKQISMHCAYSLAGILTFVLFFAIAGGLEAPGSCQGAGRGPQGPQS